MKKLVYFNALDEIMAIVFEYVLPREKSYSSHSCYPKNEGFYRKKEKNVHSRYVVQGLEMDLKYMYLSIKHVRKFYAHSKS